MNPEILKLLEEDRKNPYVSRFEEANLRVLLNSDSLEDQVKQVKELLDKPGQFTDGSLIDDKTIRVRLDFLRKKTGKDLGNTTIVITKPNGAPASKLDILLPRSYEY